MGKQYDHRHIEDKNGGGNQYGDHQGSGRSALGGVEGLIGFLVAELLPQRLIEVRDAAGLIPGR